MAAVSEDTEGNSEPRCERASRAERAELENTVHDGSGRDGHVQPALLSAVPNVVSFVGSPNFASHAKTPCAPWLPPHRPFRTGRRPVTIPAREGVQIGCALYHCVKRMPSAAMASMLGVVVVGAPNDCRSPYPLQARDVRVGRQSGQSCEYKM